jgi:peptide-methionine (R)-S-oxide reductase
MTYKVQKTDAEWRQQLTDEQYQVARLGHTEQAFCGLYWNNHEPGNYQCICCYTPLFTSTEKFDSGTG